MFLLFMFFFQNDSTEFRRSETVNTEKIEKKAKMRRRIILYMGTASILLFFFLCIMIRYPHKVPIVYKIPYTEFETFDSKPKALKALNNLRRECETRYLIKSSYRSPSWNELIGGAKNSQHVHGVAFDVIVPMSNRESFYSCAKKSGFTGFGWGNRTVHIDMGPTRWWTYGDDKKPKKGSEKYKFLHKAPQNFKRDYGLTKI